MSIGQKGADTGQAVLNKVLEYNQKHPLFSMKTTVFGLGATLLAAGLLTLLAGGRAAAQTSSQVVHLARLAIYPAQLENYRAALKEHVETALRVEPGVLTLYPVADAKQPTHITVLEIYASPAAYQAHLQSPHFLKYKRSTKAMVKSLELLDTVPLLPAAKVKN
jgi:4-carboxymuconolactone decarboxylase